MRRTARCLFRLSQRAMASATAPSGAYAATFRAADLVTTLTTTPAVKPPLDGSLQFGRTFTDHMLRVEWTSACGWAAPSLTPLAPLSIHPAAQTLHYGAHVFEGMKAYAGPDGKPRLFRPELNMARLLASAERLALPSFDPAELLACLAALVRLESGAGWLPTAPGCSLYLRPALAATTPFCGVGPPSDAVLFAFLSPCGPYLPAGVATRTTLLLDEALTRAAPGGVGDAKCGGNYAPTIPPAVRAKAQFGAAQVLFTAPGPDGRVVAEAGAMNAFFVLAPAGGGKPELVTPPLDGTILPGVTRRSVLELARAEWSDLEVSERALPVAELEAAAAQGRLLEVFATGTAAVVMPIHALIREDVPELAAAGGAIAARVAQKLADIQFGRVAHEWSVALH